MSELGPIDEYRDLFENAPCGYLTIGSDGRITKVNATLTAWTGFDADKFIGRRLHQFLNMAGRIYYETHIAPLLRMQGFFSEFALDFETAAGERLPVIANAAERRDADGTALFTALVVIKATDRRRYERQLVDSRSELQKGLATERETAELREQFIAVLGHDLRNPLAAISAGARILQRSGALQQHKELRVLDMINTTVTRMSDLIDNVLDFARSRHFPCSEDVVISPSAANEYCCRVERMCIGREFQGRHHQRDVTTPLAVQLRQELRSRDRSTGCDDN